MGNQQTKKLKVKKGKPRYRLILYSALQKLDQQSLAQICSFLEVSDFIELLCTSRNMYSQFESVSSIYQRECRKFLSFDPAPYPSQKWKTLYRSLIKMPLQGLPFKDAILRVKKVPMTRPYLVQHPIQLNNFQKAIVYYDRKLQGPRDMSETFLLNEAKKFRNFDLLMNIRLGLYCDQPLPELLANVNSLDSIFLF